MKWQRITGSAMAGLTMGALLTRARQRSRSSTLKADAARSRGQARPSTEGKDVHGSSWDTAPTAVIAGLMLAVREHVQMCAHCAERGSPLAVIGLLDGIAHTLAEEATEAEVEEVHKTLVLCCADVLDARDQLLGIEP